MGGMVFFVGGIKKRVPLDKESIRVQWGVLTNILRDRAFGMTLNNMKLHESTLITLNEIELHIT